MTCRPELFFKYFQEGSSTTQRRCEIPTNHANMIVLYNTDGSSKLIYCASWSTGAPAKEVFGLGAESANARVLGFTYFVVIHNTCEWSLEISVKRSKTMKRTRP